MVWSNWPRKADEPKCQDYMESATVTGLTPRNLDWLAPATDSPRPDSFDRTIDFWFGDRVIHNA